MKCKDCKLAKKQQCKFYRHDNKQLVFEADYYVCPLDNDDVYPADYDCIDEKAYNELLKGEL